MEIITLLSFVAIEVIFMQCLHFWTVPYLAITGIIILCLLIMAMSSPDEDGAIPACIFVGVVLHVIPILVCHLIYGADGGGKLPGHIDTLPGTVTFSSYNDSKEGKYVLDLTSKVSEDADRYTTYYMSDKSIQVPGGCDKDKTQLSLKLVGYVPPGKTEFVWLWLNDNRKIVVNVTATCSTSDAGNKGVPAPYIIEMRAINYRGLGLFVDKQSANIKKKQKENESQKNDLDTFHKDVEKAQEHMKNAAK